MRPVPDGVADDALDVDELGARLVGLAGRLAAATCRWLLLVADFDAREGCVRFGLPSTVRWLAHYCGLSRRTAIDHVRVARALSDHPPLAAAMAAGRLSFSHVRAISRVITADDHVLVTDLIQAAEHATVGQLETLVRGLHTVDRHENATWAGPYLTRGWTSDSRWRLSARLDPEDGALVDAALDAIARNEGLCLAQARAAHRNRAQTGPSARTHDQGSEAEDLVHEVVA